MKKTLMITVFLVGSSLATDNVLDKELNTYQPNLSSELYTPAEIDNFSFDEELTNTPSCEIDLYGFFMRVISDMLRDWRYATYQSEEEPRWVGY